MRPKKSTKGGKYLSFVDSEESQIELNNSTDKGLKIKFNKILDALQLSIIQIKDLTINETRLEDVFLKLTKN